MKKVLLASLILSATVFASETTPQRVVREFVVNTTSADWWLNGGWTWTDDALTHFAGAGGVAELRTMPALTAGHTYAIDFTHSGSTHGDVEIALGKAKPAVPYTWEGRFPIILTVIDPDSMLTLTASNDYAGSISNIRIVELGEELVPSNGLTVTRESSEEEKSSPSPVKLTTTMPILAGHTYRLYFGVSESPEIPAEAKHGKAMLGGHEYSFSRGANYRFDVLAVNDAPLVVNLAGAWFDGLVSRVSVREIISDPAPGDAGTKTDASESR